MGIDWQNPWLLTLALPALAALWWAARGSRHPMPARRRRWLTMVRGLLVALAVIALAGPAWRGGGGGRALALVLDHSHSQGEAGMRAARERAARILATVPAGTPVAVLSLGARPRVLAIDSRAGAALPAAGTGDQPNADAAPRAAQGDADDSDFAAAVDLARGLFPPDTARQVVLISDGVQTRGDLLRAARDAGMAGVQLVAVANAGEVRPDVRVVRLASSRTRSHEGAAITLTAELESSLAGSGQLVLYENGVEVERRPLTLGVGESKREEFRRVPAERNLYTYRLRAEGFTADRVPGNDAALALVDVAGRPRLLHVAGDPGEAHYLAEALDREGIRLDARPPGELPDSPQELAAYDGVILADVPARMVPERSMAALRDYVEELGGGLLVTGGVNSFGVGGWFRTPLEELLPVKMQAPDSEEQAGVALALVIDRSGSMSGDKIECVKSAAAHTTTLLSAKDWLGVVAFDSDATWVVPMARLSSKADASARIASISLGGGTNIMPGMVQARAALQRLPAKVRHMIVLTDGVSTGSGYPELAAQCRAERITVSTVAVGGDADNGLLQAMAKSGGGTFHLANDPNTVPRIFTQDAMTHLGKLVREQPFKPRGVERHPMVQGWPVGQAPQLLGYVRTLRRATAQVPLVTDLGDPLLAHWRFGLGKVTAFTSDCSARWSGLWLANWPAGYVQLWAQVVRETAREPQGRRLDLRLEGDGRQARIVVDALADAGTWRNDAVVHADVFHVPAAGSSRMLPLASLALEQDGPGRYLGAFTPDAPGVYLVRARSGADLVSAGLVHNPGSEVASGRVDRDLLSRAAALTGGALLADGDDHLPAPPPAPTAARDLRPWLLLAILLLFIADLALRRWENVLGVVDRLRPARGSG